MDFFDFQDGANHPEKIFIVISTIGEIFYT